MTKHKIQNRRRARNLNDKTLVLVFVIWILNLFCHLNFDICHLYAQGQFVYDAKGKRDPFIPLVTPDGRLLNLKQQEEKGDLTLEGIIYDKYGLSYAIVNGEIVKIGDKVGEYQVLRIESNKVIFLKQGEPTEIELKKEEP